jgi:diacylglycerol kinase
MNSAIESLVDLVSPEKNSLAGKAKDIAAGAVLVAAICAAIVGLIIFVPKGWEML